MLDGLELGRFLAFGFAPPCGHGSFCRSAFVFGFSTGFFVFPCPQRSLNQRRVLEYVLQFAFLLGNLLPQRRLGVFVCGLVQLVVQATNSAANLGHLLAHLRGVFLQTHALQPQPLTPTLRSLTQPSLFCRGFFSSSALFSLCPCLLNAFGFTLFLRNFVQLSFGFVRFCLGLLKFFNCGLGNLGVRRNFCTNLCGQIF